MSTSRRRRVGRGRVVQQVAAVVWLAVLETRSFGSIRRRYVPVVPVVAGRSARFDVASTWLRLYVLALVGTSSYAGEPPLEFAPNEVSP